jgi:hypothetical protein
MKRLLVFALFVVSGAITQTQSVPNAGPNDSFGWSQVGTTLAEVQAFVYKYYLDGAVTGSVFSGVKCSGTATPFNCQVRIPSFSAGQHSITLTAANSTGESTPSTPFAFVYGNPPLSPNNISIIRAP